jgi:hypothetical protein
MKLRLLRFSAVSSALFSILAGINASATVLYVDLNSPSPTPPYSNWVTAATNIQDAIDAATDGDEILVTNGVYQTGGRVVYGSLTNRVAISKAVTVQSVGGPAVTIIRGYPVWGDSGVRCVYLTNRATLIGFTLTNGATRGNGDINLERSGGGVWCESGDAVLSNCVLTANSGWHYGGGAYKGTLYNCLLVNNRAYHWGGGACYTVLNNCTLIGNSVTAFGGGAAYSCELNHCIILTNSAKWAGGVDYGTLNNCILIGNSAGVWSGGAFSSTLNNCTLTGNSAGDCGGVGDSTLYNSIVYHNVGGNHDGTCTFSFSCTTPDPGGTGNMTRAPLFLNLTGGDLHLQSNSPCINTGNNSYAMVTNDLDGNPRIMDGVVDMGAYEFQKAVPFIVSI